MRVFEGSCAGEVIAMFIGQFGDLKMERITIKAISYLMDFFVIQFKSTQSLTQLFFGVVFEGTSMTIICGRSVVQNDGGTRHRFVVDPVTFFAKHVPDIVDVLFVELNNNIIIDIMILYYYNFKSNTTLDAHLFQSLFFGKL